MISSYLWGFGRPIINKCDIWLAHLGLDHLIISMVLGAVVVEKEYYVIPIELGYEFLQLLLKRYTLEIIVNYRAVRPS